MKKSVRNRKRFIKDRNKRSCFPECVCNGIHGAAVLGEAGKVESNDPEVFLRFPRERRNAARQKSNDFDCRIQGVKPHTGDSRGGGGPPRVTPPLQKHHLPSSAFKEFAAANAVPPRFSCSPFFRVFRFSVFPVFLDFFCFFLSFLVSSVSCVFLS